MTKNIYEVARVEDIGTAWQLTGIVLSDLQYLDAAGSKYINLSHNTAKKLNELLTAGNTVIISKDTDFNGPELQPWDLSIKESLTELQIKKNSILFNARKRLNQELVLLNILSIYNYLEHNNNLINNGYIITEKNREEKYLEILNTGDSALIHSLELYLEAKDELSSRNYIWTQYKNLEKEINLINSIDELAGLENQFFSTGF